MPKNDLGCLLNLVKRLRNEKVMTLGALSFATKKWRYWALVDRQRLRGRPGVQFAKWDKGEEIRNGSPFESRKKALRQKSYSVLVQTTLKATRRLRRKKSERVPEKAPGLARFGLEKNDARLCFAKTRSKIPRFKCFLEILINILF